MVTATPKIGARKHVMAAAALPLALPLQAATPVKPTVVLVHGAFADGSSWSGVVARLQADHYPVVVAANPLRGVDGDSASLAALLKTIAGPIVLVGHSYGGVVISNAGHASDAVKALVYVAAMAPDRGESVAGLAGQFPGSLLHDAALTAPLPDGTVELYVRPDTYRLVLAADVPANQANLMALAQRPTTLAALTGLSGAPAWKSIPSWFIYGDADLSMPPALHAFLAKRAHAKEIVVLGGASHALPVSHPQQVALMVERAADALAPPAESTTP